jgi:pyruvate/2-oxoglutarate dehydrogenase complex dihydrolipoamide dehydrogenase (E3) component
LATGRMNKRDMVIIGGGAGGLVVASVAAQLGLKVTLIEKVEKLGGDCLHYGCVPSKTLIHAARVASLMRRGPEFGLPACEPAVDLGRVADHVQAVIDRIQLHDDPERFRGYGCEVIFGPATFIDSHNVQVNDRVIQGRRFVIATGSRPLIPPIDGLQETGCLTNEDLFKLRDLPGRLLVLGGGPVGLEMAQAFARLGSDVTVVERLPHLLPQEDPEVADALQVTLESEGMKIHTSTRAVQVVRDGEKTQVICSQGPALVADRLLVAVGRRPAVSGLGLDAAGIEHDERGIRVDRRQRTSQKHIYACGDVCGPYPFTHMAEYQAGIVISNAVFRIPKKTDYRVVPWVTYTDPELARVGLTEQQARDRGMDPAVLTFSFQDIDRAITDGETTGLARLVVHKGRILGASLLGAHAGELVHEIVLAMKTGAGIGEISAAIHAYPTLSQIHRRTVNTWYGRKLFSPGTRRLVRWINRLLP